jgi:hypothetical protein
MEDGRSGLDLTAAAWNRGGEREQQRLLAAARSREREEGGRKVTKMALEAKQDICLA